MIRINTFTPWLQGNALQSRHFDTRPHPRQRVALQPGVGTLAPSGLDLRLHINPIAAGQRTGVRADNDGCQAQLQRVALQPRAWHGRVDRFRISENRADDCKQIDGLLRIRFI